MLVTYPFPLSSEDSITVPTAFLFGFAFKANISASKRTLSNKSSMFRFCFADIS